MIKFGFKEYETEFADWSKHHKTLGIHVKRVYENGEVILPNDEQLKTLVVENEEALKSKRVQLRNRETFEAKNATDYYLPLQNLDYQEANLDYYSVGATNTKQTTHIRFTFLLEYDKFILDHHFESEGSYAANFYNLLDGMDFVEDLIDDILEQEKPIEETGIIKGEEEDYKIILVTSIGEVIDVEVEKRELLSGLVGVEVYRFDHEIVG